MDIFINAIITGQYWEKCNFLYHIPEKNQTDYFLKMQPYM